MARGSEGSSRRSSRPKRCDWRAPGRRPPGQVAKDLDLTETALRAWIKQAETDESPAPKEALTSGREAELSALRKEVRVLRTERELLKKAAAFFAKETT